MRIDFLKGCLLPNTSYDFGIEYKKMMVLTIKNINNNKSTFQTYDWTTETDSISTPDEAPSFPLAFRNIDSSSPLLKNFDVYGESNTGFIFDTFTNKFVMLAAVPILKWTYPCSAATNEKRGVPVRGTRHR